MWVVCSCAGLVCLLSRQNQERKQSMEGGGAIPHLQPQGLRAPASEVCIFVSSHPRSQPSTMLTNDGNNRVHDILKPRNNVMLTCCGGGGACEGPKAPHQYATPTWTPPRLAPSPHREPEPYGHAGPRQPVQFRVRTPINRSGSQRILMHHGAPPPPPRPPGPVLHSRIRVGGHSPKLRCLGNS